MIPFDLKSGAQTMAKFTAPWTWLPLLLAGLLAVDASAQSRVSTSAASFLTLGTGARGSALGHAYTATAEGAAALAWNPAGAANRDGTRRTGSLFFSHANWLADINFNAFAAVIPAVGSGVIGIQIAQLDYGRMDVRTVDRPGGTGETFGANDLVIGLTYAQPLTDRFFIGGTIKRIRQQIYDMRASATAVDVGFVLQTDYFNGLRLAASIMNFGGLMRMEGVNGRIFVDIDQNNSGSNNALPAALETGEWNLPLSFKFGAALPVYTSQYVTFELLADAHQTNDNELNADFGSEIRFSMGPVNLDLRGGYKDAALGDQVDSHSSFGAGLDIKLADMRVGADFAYVPFDRLGNVQIVDFRIQF